MNGCWAGSRLAHHVMRVVLDRDEVSARSRSVPLDSRGIAVLRDRRPHTITVGVKHVAPTGKAEKGGKVAGRDRLSDRKGVAAGWHRHLHPVEEHTWVDVVYHPVANGVIDAAEGLGRAVLELCTSRSCRRDLAHLNRRSRRCWSGRGCRRCCSCRRSSSCSCRRGRGDVAVNERGAFECAAGDVIEEGGNIVRAIELHQGGALAGLARNQDVAAQALETDRKILVESYLPLLIECGGLEEGAVVAEGAYIVGDGNNLFRTVPLHDI